MKRESNSTEFSGDAVHYKDVLVSAFKRWQEGLGYISIFAVVPGLIGATAETAKANEVTSEAGHAAGQTRRRPSRPDFLRARDRLPAYLKGGTDIVDPLSGNDDCAGQQVPAGAYTAAAPYTDTGDTTGANNTVTRPHYVYYYYYWHDTPGPDHVYTFTLTARGANPQITVSRTSGTYEPVIYLLDGRYGCPAGTNQFAYNELTWANGPAGSASIFGALEYVPLNIPLHLFVDSASTSGSGPYQLRLQDVTVAPTVAIQDSDFDFDGDGKADLGVFRPSETKFYVERSSQQDLVEVQFGLSTDKIAPADYDGDNKTDIAVFRDGIWWWLNSTDSTILAAHWGTDGDVPVPADFTADGRAELAVFRNGLWYIFDRTNGSPSVVNFGVAGDKPVVADYDNDGRADVAVYRAGVWHLNRSTRGYFTVPWGGLASDIPVPADYDGDGRADLMIYRDGEWWIRASLFNDYYYGYKSGDNFGQAGDIPVPADYNGDSYTDIAVFRNGVWYIRQSRGGPDIYRAFGLSGDKPLPSAYVP